MVISIGKCLAEENLSIFHSITAENARSTGENKGKGTVISEMERLNTDLLPSKAEQGVGAGVAKLTSLCQRASL